MTAPEPKMTEEPVQGAAARLSCEAVVGGASGDAQITQTADIHLTCDRDISGLTAALSSPYYDLQIDWYR